MALELKVHSHSLRMTSCIISMGASSVWLLASRLSCPFSKVRVLICGAWLFCRALRLFSVVYISSPVPLVSRICPNDVCRIWKSGAKLRVDITLLGFENMSWIRGRRSFIFKGEGEWFPLSSSLLLLSSEWFFTIEMCSCVCERWCSSIYDAPLVSHLPCAVLSYALVSINRQLGRVDGSQPWWQSGHHWTLWPFPGNGTAHSGPDET